MIHFQTKITNNRQGPLFGIVLTPADLAMVTSGHPLYLNLQDKVDLAKVGGVGVYFVRDSKELVKVLKTAGMPDEAILEAGLTMDGMEFEPLPEAKPEEDPFFS